MQLAPLYLDRPLIVLDGDPSAIAAPTIAQRQRLVETVTGVSDDDLCRPSRCDEWSGVDVIAHLDGTNRFWSMSIAAGDDPDLAFAVDIAEQIAVTTLTPHVERADVAGSSVALLEAFSARGPFPGQLDDNSSWMLLGLMEAFDQV